jgi:hypothetical protein
MEDRMKIKVEFKGDASPTMVVTFDRDAGTATTGDGRSGTYTRHDGARGIDITSNDGQTLALTFAEDFKPEAGFSTRYTSDRGSGVATILSIT